jgi:5-methylcytosine-specific restriction endonuclease McrA
MVRKVQAKKDLAVSKSAVFFDSPEWKETRYKALLKYGRRCACCSATPQTGAIIQVDHIKPRSKYPSLALDLNNLQVLCKDCNMGKGTWDRTDFR